MAELSIQEFIKKLAATQNETEKLLLQSHFDMATKILHRAQDNIKATFGSSGDGGGTARSDLTKRSDGGTAGSSGRSGALMRSGELTYKNKKTLTVSFGGMGVPYAVIHEFGGVIRPKKPNGWLTIPFQPAARGKRAREFELQIAWDEEHGPHLADDSGEIFYLLRRKATIPARPYLGPAVKQEMSDASYRSILKRLYGSSNGLEFEVN